MKNIKQKFQIFTSFGLSSGQGWINSPFTITGKLGLIILHIIDIWSLSPQLAKTSSISSTKLWSPISTLARYLNTQKSSTKKKRSKEYHFR